MKKAETILQGREYIPVDLKVIPQPIKDIRVI